MTDTPELMTVEQAAAFRAAYAADLAVLNRKTKAELVAIERSELAARNRERIYGGPVTKAEYLSSILEMRWPVARSNEASHVLNHGPGETWSGCQWCQCQVTWTDGNGYLHQCEQAPHPAGGMHSHGQVFYFSTDPVANARCAVCNRDGHRGLPTDAPAGHAYVAPVNPLHTAGRS